MPVHLADTHTQHTPMLLASYGSRPLVRTDASSIYPTIWQLCLFHHKAKDVLFIRQLLSIHNEKGFETQLFIIVCKHKL